MKRKRFKPEEIVNKLREADVLLSKGQTVAQACKQIGGTGLTYYRWRRVYGGMKTNQARDGPKEDAATGAVLASRNRNAGCDDFGGIEHQWVGGNARRFSR